MTKFKNLTETQQIKFIDQLQKDVGKKFKKYFKDNTISSKKAKRIMDYILYNYSHMKLGELRKHVILGTKIFIMKKLNSDIEK